MTIAQRLSLLATAAIVSLLALAGINYLQMNRVYDAASFSSENGIPSMQLLDRMLLEFGRVRVRANRHALVDDAASKREVEAKIDEARRLIAGAQKDYERYCVDAEDRRLLEAGQAAFADYQRELDTLLAASRNPADHAALTRQVLGLVPAATRFEEALATHLEFNAELVKRAAKDAEDTKRQASVIALAILAVALVLMAAIAWATLRSIRLRIDGAERLASRIAGGDLTEQPAAQGPADEIGRLIAALEAMRVALGRTIGQIVGGSVEIAEAAGGLSSAAQQVAGASQHQSSSTASAAAAVEQLTVSIDHVGTGADDARDQAREAGSLAETSGRCVEAAAGRIHEVAGQVETTAGHLAALSEQVHQIDRITVVIRDVADQTNLLALNAAIEAARAGEQGRGFAVVADEVRKLAERTSASAQEISAVVSAVQRGAAGAVGSMEASRTLAGEVAAAAGEASGSMATILDSTATMQASIRGISEALQEQRTTSTALARNVEAIAQASEENAAAVSSVAATATRLAAVSDTLRESVAGFRL